MRDPLRLIRTIYRETLHLEQMKECLGVMFWDFDLYLLLGEYGEDSSSVIFEEYLFGADNLELEDHILSKAQEVFEGMVSDFRNRNGRPPRPGEDLVYPDPAWGQPFTEKEFACGYRIC